MKGASQTQKTGGHGQGETGSGGDVETAELREPVGFSEADASWWRLSESLTG